MATYNSATAGNWSSTSTWGGSGPPSNGDTVNITHTVTYDINDDVNTIATINLNTNGTLQWTGGVGTKTIRFTNMSISGGKLLGKDGTFIRCLGYIQVANTNDSEITMKGSVPNFQTTLSSELTVGSGYLSVTDSSGFAVGDYISVYDYNTISYSVQTNECFIINSIDETNIFLRRYVGPKFTLIRETDTSSNQFYTSDDVRAWRQGMKFVINIDVLEVDTVDVFNKIIYTTTNASQTHSINDVGYETGVEYPHLNGENVYKLCTTVVSAQSGNNYIDVGSSGGWFVDDEIAIGGSTYANSENKKIQSISVGGGTGGSDRLTLTANLTANHDAGGIVVKINRDCVFHGNTSDTLSATSGYIYVLANSANRTFRFENFEMRYYGNNASSYYYGLNLRNTYDRSVILLNMVGRHAHKSSDLGSIRGYSYYYYVMLNNVVYDTQSGLGLYSSGDNSYYSGNITIKVNSIGYWNYNYSNIAWDYNIGESSGYLMYTIYNGYNYFNTIISGKPATRNWYIRANYISTVFYGYTNENRCYHINKVNINNLILRFITIDMLKSGISVFKNVNFESGSLFIGVESLDIHKGNTYNLLNQITILDNYKFIPHNRMIRYQFGYAEMDYNIRKLGTYSWKFTPKNNTYYYMCGFFAMINGIKGRTIKVGGYLRKDTTTNATVRIDFYDDLNNLLTSSTLTTTNTWEWKSATYTIPNDMIIIVKIGGYGSTGNFWVSHPTIYTDDCIYDADTLSSFWIKGDPESTGIRLFNGIKMM
jgi:hypothetical protein